MTRGRKLFIAGVIVILLVLIMSTFFGKKGLFEIHQARRRQMELFSEVQRLEKEKARLEKEIEELKKDPRAVEEEARRKLWLMKPEEKVIILPSPKNKEKERIKNF